MKPLEKCLPFAIAAADQLIKAAVRRLPQGTVFFRIPGFLELTHYTNTGAAFSLFAGNPLAIALLTALLLAVLLFVLHSLSLTRQTKRSLLCLVGGGAGNLIDRVLFGGVTDYIHFLPVRFPVFNLADICITLSIGYLLILMLCGRLERQTEERHE